MWKNRPKLVQVANELKRLKGDLDVDLTEVQFIDWVDN